MHALSSYRPRVVEHGALTEQELDALSSLFDREYFEEQGAWNPDGPYGYAPASTHAILFDTEARAVAHVGFQRRTITVGGLDLMVAGTGGVLVDQRHRGLGLGGLAMKVAQDAMRADTDLQFGYLGCREAVVPFYTRTGWTRIHVRERSAPLTPTSARTSVVSTSLAPPAETSVRAASGTATSASAADPKPAPAASDLTVVDAHGPVLICPLRDGIESWPRGDVDLRGGPW